MRKNTGAGEGDYVEAFGLVLSDNSLAGTENPFPVTMAVGQGSALTTQLDFDSGTNPIYIGVAPSGSATSAAAWQIKMLTYDGSGNLTAVQYASVGATDLIWDDRAGYTYS